MNYIAGLLLCVTVVSADTGSNGYVYGGGNVGVGQIQLDSHSQSLYNGLPSTIGQSMNSGSGTGVSINGQANSGVNVNYINDNMPNQQVITGNSNANSNGNAATGQLNNNDQSNSANSNGLSVDGHSQIWANGTGVSVNNNANSNVVKYPITTTTPCSTTELYCPGYCFPSGCYCACPIYENGVVPDAAKSKSKLNSKGNQRKSLQNARSRGQNAGKNAAARSQQRSSFKNKAQSNVLGNARKRT